MAFQDRKPAARGANLWIDLTTTRNSSSTGDTATIDLTGDTNLVDSTITRRKRRRGRKDSTSRSSKKKKRRKELVTRPFDCSVCMETVEPFQGHFLAACGHSFCKLCLHGYIQSKLSSKEVQSLTCPDTSCRLNLDTLDVRACTLELGDASCWQKFQQVATETFLDTAASSKNTSIRRCPTNHCNFTFQYEASDNPQQGQLFICPECQEAYCLECPVVQGKVGPAHDDTCYNVMEEIRQSKERKRKLEEWKRENGKADERFQELLRKEGRSGKTRPCPKCHTPITKNGGCDHMYCSNCNTNFNWSSTKATW